MELVGLLLVAISAIAGVVLKGVLSAIAGRILLGIGSGALVLALGALVLAVLDWWPLDTYTAGFIAVCLLAVAALVLPLAITALLFRSRSAEHTARHGR